MAITRLYDFRGEAEVAGVMRIVRYRHDDGLTIEGLSLFEANDLLNALATGSLAGVEPRASAERSAVGAVVHADPGKPTARPMADATAEQEPAKSKPAPVAAKSETKPVEKPAAEPKPEPKSEPKPNGAAAAAEKPAEPAAEKPAAAKPKAAQTPAEAKPAPKAAPAAAAPPPSEEEPKEDEDDDLGDDADTGDDGDDGALIASLQDAKKLRDVVGALADAGITTPDALVAKALAIKDSVPLLKRIGDLDRRVRRTAAAMGIGDAGDDADGATA